MKHTAKYVLVAVGAGVAGILIGLGSIGYFSQKQEQKAVLPVQTQETQKTVEAPKQEVVTQQSSGVTWLPMPERISTDLGLVKIEKKPEILPIKNSVDKYITGAEYFKIGIKNVENIIMAKIKFDYGGFEGHDVAFFEELQNGYALIAKLSYPGLADYNSISLDSLDSKFTNNVASIDRESEYEDLFVPYNFEYEEVQFKNDGSLVGFMPETDFLKNMTKVTDFTFGTLYLSVQPRDLLHGVKALKYYILRKHIGLAVKYNYFPKIINNDFVLNAIWNNGAKNNARYYELGRDAYLGTPALTNNSLSELIETGKTPFGPVYEFKDPNTSLLKIIYDNSLVAG